MTTSTPRTALCFFGSTPLIAPRRLAMLGILLAAAAALVASLALASPAQAALTWPAPQNLSFSLGQEPHVAIDTHDRATVVWSGPRKPSSALPSSDVQSIRLGADGTRGMVRTLSAAGERELELNDNPQVAIDSHDRATVVWSGDGVQSIRLRADGTPGTVRTLSAAGGYGLEPQVAIDSHDRATVVWSGPRIQSVRLGADGTPGTVRTLSPHAANSPQVAIDSHDRATVVWSSADNSVHSIRLSAEGVPRTVHTLSGEWAYFPEVAIDSHDRATVVWSRLDGASNGVQSLRIGADGNPGTVQTLSAHADQFAQVAIDSHDRATVVWSDDRVPSIIRLGADGTPGTVQRLSGQGAFDLQVAIDSQDRATVVWSGNGVQSIGLGADGTPGMVQTLVGGLPAHPQVAIDSHDRPTVVWESFGRVWSATAAFEATHTLSVRKPGTGAGTVTSSPAGISCGSTCAHAYVQGTAVKLAATPASGSTFAGWSGSGCSGLATCTVTMGADRTVTATFEKLAAPDARIAKAKISSKRHKARFKFKASGEASGFQCKLRRPQARKRAKFSRCGSPKTYKHLKRGRYVFKVRAKGPGGTDPSPAKKKFKIR